MMARGLVSVLLFALGACHPQKGPAIRTVYVQDCGQRVAVDLHRNGSLYLKGTDIGFRYGETCY